MVKKLTIEDIKKQEEKIKAEKAKLAKAKKQIITQENEKIGKRMRKEFRFKDYADFEQWLVKNLPQNESKNSVEEVADKKVKISDKNPYDFLTF